ncbi:ubiquitin-conjugating enzyme E2 T-like [Frankliniella occidentalis]|uniref:Ubiquitin-conjugating enzyme E2 T-like n=1 Tax=Frankliniella occidentalis TaxID=133901 RepID=A0A9C6X392_FRAOC|nr:ubiquitin-conjugating enzyme E2 T-like [Frankliniella occidentalis]
MEKMLLNRLNGEMKKINEGLPQGVVSLAPVEGENGPNLMNWRGAIEGPVGSSYEGGLFNLDIIIPDDYPLSPPKVTMLTKIYHPNISSSGYICISILKRRSDDGQTQVSQTL